MAKLYTWDPRKRKKVLCGEIVGTALFRHVEKNKHFCWKYNGYGIQVPAFAEIKKANIEKIIIKEDTKAQWEADIKTWEENGIVDDLGNGPQRFLPMRYQAIHPDAITEAQKREQEREIIKMKQEQKKLF